MPPIIVYFLLLLPFSVYWLPSFQSTYHEDLLLLGIFVYIFIRTFDLNRRTEPEVFHWVINFVCLSTLYCIGWYGFARGYLAQWSYLCTIYIIYLILMVFLTRPNRHQLKSLKLPQIWKSLQKSILLLLLIYFLMSFVLVFHNSTELFSAKTSIQYGLGIVVLALSLLLSQYTPRLVTAKAHVLPLIASILCFLPVWKENLVTYIHWYSAGELERAWTPYKYFTEEEIKAAELKPLEATHDYLKVLERIQYKGDLPQLLHWQFYMKLRMATQMQRMGNAPACAAYLPPSYDQEAYKMGLIRNLWGVELLNDATHHPPKYQKNERIWVDFEITDSSNIFALDRWGRVYEKLQGVFILRMESDQHKINAVAFEVVNDDFVVLYSDGEISSNGKKLVLDDFVTQQTGKHWVDLEYVSAIQAFVICSDYGQVVLAGYDSVSSTVDFPQFQEPLFDKAVVVDLEIDPNQQGFYLLDHFGAIHAFNLHSPSLPYKSPEVPQALLPYWGDAMAVDLEVDVHNQALYVYNRIGELYSITPTPFIETYRPDQTYPFRGVSAQTTPKGNVVLFESNGVHHVVFEQDNAP